MSPAEQTQVFGPGQAAIKEMVSRDRNHRVFQSFAGQGRPQSSQAIRPTIRLQQLKEGRQPTGQRLCFERRDARSLPAVSEGDEALCAALQPTTPPNEDQ